jgi:hypothetical protein
MRERNNRVIIVEGVQGSGKTTASEHLAQIGCVSFRGIPSGEELTANSEGENWRQSMVIFERAIEASEGLGSVMDRSIWSLVAYNIGRKPAHRSLIYNLGKKMFERRLDGKINCAVVFLEVNPEISFYREDGRGVHSHRLVEDVYKESQVYQWLMENLERDGFNVIHIKNNDIPREEFLDLVERVAVTTS